MEYQDKNTPNDELLLRMTGNLPVARSRYDMKTLKIFFIMSVIKSEGEGEAGKTPESFGNEFAGKV